MRYLSPAKINLHLRVGAVRQDGFHPLHTWMVAVGLFDKLDFLPHPPGAAMRSDDGVENTHAVTLSCSNANVPIDDRNLIVRAGRLLLEQAGGGLAKTAPPGGYFPVRVVLGKAIPMGGGLGGGSSNAAVALRTLNALWDLDLPMPILRSLAARLGSDVPFFLNSPSRPSAICTGRGEWIEPINAPACRWAVLMLPPFGISTGEAYATLDALRGDGFTTEFDDDIAGWTTLPAIDLLPRLVNDLEIAAFALRPDLDALRRSAEAIAARPVRMSGSGSTLFTLFDTKEEAQQAGQEIQTRLSLATLAVCIAP